MILNYILLECSGNGFGSMILFGLCMILLVPLVITYIILSLVKHHRKSKNNGKEASQGTQSIDTALSVIKPVSIILFVVMAIACVS